MDSRLSYLYVCIGASLWGFIGVFVRALADLGFTPMQIVVLRTFTASLCITPLLFYQKGGFKVALSDLWLFFGTGVFGITFNNFCYVNSIESGGLAVAALLLYTAPSFVMVLSLFIFREPFTKGKGLALFAAFIGCCLVTGVFAGRLTLTVAGLLYGLGSALGYALYSIFSKLALRRYSSTTICAYSFYFALIAALVTIVPELQLPPVAAGELGGFLLRTAGASLGLGFICAVLPYLFYTKGLGGLEAGRASVIAFLEPVVAAVLGLFLFAEPLTPAKMGGMLLILVSVAALSLRKK